MPLPHTVVERDSFVRGRLSRRGFGWGLAKGSTLDSEAVAKSKQSGKGKGREAAAEGFR